LIHCHSLPRLTLRALATHARDSAPKDAQFPSHPFWGIILYRNKSVLHNQEQPVTVDPITEFKRQAGYRAVDYVRSGMIVGLGHGSTAIHAIRRIAQLLREGQLHDILGIPCSRRVEQDARELGIPLTTLDDHPVVDLTIDGADEVDPDLNVIKGGGGALLREKIVAQATRREIIVVDETKLSPALGTRWAIPIEVVPFGWPVQIVFLESLGGRPTLRRLDDGMPFFTDQGNLIIDCAFGPIVDPAALVAQLDARAGIVEHGLFFDLVSDVIVAGKDGIRHLERKSQ
jgi:ribose 5-phosphate isomerase A